MSEAGHEFTGRCHCGAINVALSFTRLAEEMQVRSCQCDFCTRHGSVTASDPKGAAVIEIEAGALVAYKFGSRTGTTIVCARCGVYAGIMLAEGPRIWSAANTRGLGIPEFKDRVGVQMVYEDESAQERIERRKQKWTPTEIRFKL
jgi:hypothetical protein